MDESPVEFQRCPQHPTIYFMAKMFVGIDLAGAPRFRLGRCPVCSLGQRGYVSRSKLPLRLV